MAKALLSGFRVVEMAHPYTEYAGLILAGLGAEVWLVEPVAGASTRLRRPRVPGAGESPRGSMAFLARNANKKSVTIDPQDRDDRLLLGALCERADVVLRAPDDTGVGAVVAETQRPVVVSMTDASGLGTSSVVGFAASGGLASSGWPDQPPCNAPSWLALDGASIYAAVMALIGAHARLNGDVGVRYEIPYAEAAVAAITPWTRPLAAYGMEAAGQGAVSQRLGAGGLPVYEAADGYVRVVAATPKQWAALVTLLGSPDDFVTGPWADATFRLENSDAMTLLVNECTRQQSVHELFHEGQRLGLTISPVYTLTDFRADPHVRARAMFSHVDDPEFGHMELLRPPVTGLGSEVAVEVEPAPAPGADNDLAREVAASAVAALPKGRGDMRPVAPLAGIRVLELGVGAVVPEAASLLALFGAEVLKIESSVRPDFLRLRGMGGYLDVNNCPTFNQLNLGVKSVAVNMNEPDGVTLVQSLAKGCDLVMENMRGGIVGRWGLDHAGVARINPDAVYLSSQGLGSGPYDGYQTYGPNLQTFSGVTSQWAHEDDPFAVGTNLNHPDHMAGKQALVPVLAALLRRREGGSGIAIDATQVEGAAYLIGDRYLRQFLEGREPPPCGNGSPDMVPHGCYRCRDEDRWVAVAVESDEQWRRLCELIGSEPAGLDADAGFTARITRAAAIDAWLNAWTCDYTAGEAENRLRAAGLPASRVVTGQDLIDAADAHASGFFASIAHPTSGTREYTGLPILVAGAGRPAARRPPLLGEHTEYVLYDVLGLDADEARRLMRQGVVGE